MKNGQTDARAIGSLRDEIREARWDPEPARFLAIVQSIARELVCSYEIPVEFEEPLLGTLHCWISTFFDAGCGKRTGAFGYSSAVEFRDKVQRARAGCQGALTHCKALYNHLILLDMQPAIAGNSGPPDWMRSLRHWHGQAKAALDHDLQAIERMLDRIATMEGQKPIGLTKSAAKPAVSALGQSIYLFWMTCAVDQHWPHPTLQKECRFVGFATYVYELLGYPVDKRGMVERLKSVVRSSHLEWPKTGEPYLEYLEPSPNTRERLLEIKFADVFDSKGIGDILEHEERYIADPDLLNEEQFTRLMAATRQYKEPSDVVWFSRLPRQIQQSLIDNLMFPDEIDLYLPHADEAVRAAYNAAHPANDRPLDLKARGTR